MEADLEQAEAHTRAKVRWWQWPNLLSLDAPAVACAWQVLLARSLGLHPHWEVVLSLGTAVWGIYVVDRLLDGPLEGTPRHRFASRHKETLIASVLAVILPVLIWVVPTLSRALLTRGFLIASGCLIYLAAAQISFQERTTWRGRSKSLSMSVLFASGIILPFWDRSNIQNFFATIAVVCGNIALTDQWEHHKNSQIPLRLALAGGGALLLQAGSDYLVALGLGCWFMLAIDVASAFHPIGEDANVLCLLADVSLALAACLVLLIRF